MASGSFSLWFVLLSPNKPGAELKPTIVLIHGYGFDHHSWDPIDDVLTGYKRIRLSLPGFGENDPGPITGSYSISELAAWFWEWLSLEGLHEVHLAGHSMGGYVCMEMLAQQPDRVMSLGLIHSHVFADTDEKKAQRSATAEEILTSGKDGFVHRFYPPLFSQITAEDFLIQQLVSRGLQFPDSAWSRGALAMRDRRDHRETLSQCCVPVLMVMGDKDRAVPLDLIYQQAALPERNSLHIYPDTGHMSMYEAPERLREDFGRFYAALV